MDGVEIGVRPAAQLAAAGGEGAVELRIPPGLLGSLLEVAVGLGVAEGLGGPVEIGLAGDEGPAALPRAKVRGAGLLATVESNRMAVMVGAPIASAIRPVSGSRPGPAIFVWVESHSLDPTL